MRKFGVSILAAVFITVGFVVTGVAQGFSGQWEGQWDSVYDVSGWMALDIVQNGSSLTGTLDLEDEEGEFFYDIPITGTVAGNTATITGMLNDGGSVYQLQYTQALVDPTGQFMSGNYTILEDGYWWDSGTFIVVRQLQSVGNDNFANAATLAGTSGQTSGSNIGATKEPGEPSHAGNDGGASVWWKWTAPSDGHAVIDTFDSGFDTVLAVYTGSSVVALSECASNDDSIGFLQSYVYFSVQKGVTYWIAVDGYGGETGNIVLSWDFKAVVGTWAPMNMQGAPQVMPSHYMNQETQKEIWTGTEWLVFGASLFDETSVGARYNPSLNTWTAMNMTGAPAIDWMRSLSVWTGSRLLVCGYSMQMELVGGSYDPVANVWTGMSMTGAPALDPAWPIQSYWTGSKWMVIGVSLEGQDWQEKTFEGTLYDPVANTWTAMNMTGAPNMFPVDMLFDSIWTGTRWLLFGQNKDTEANAGGSYNPAANTWTTMQLSGAPEMWQVKSVWSGNEWVILGSRRDNWEQIGALYNPVANTWRTMNLSSAPEFTIGSASSFWTGAKWILLLIDAWGCAGAIYDPGANAWSEMNMEGLPSISDYSAEIEWTGTTRSEEHTV